MISVIDEQQRLCEKYQSVFVNSPLELKVGISLSVKEGVLPIHGLRHPLEGDTTGWYIWSGDFSDDPNFFKPVLVKDLKNWNRSLVKYLGLAPGWRFLFTYDYEDVWEDLSLLNI